MGEFCLRIGAVNRKLLLPAIAAVLYIIMDIIEYKADIKDIHTIFDLVTRGISYSCAIFIPLVQKLYDKTKKFDEVKFKCTKRSILHIIILYSTYITYFGLFVYLSTLKSKDEENTKDFKMSHYHGSCSEESLSIIFILIISKFLLDKQLYVHHYIGLIIFIISSISIDITFNLSLFTPGFLFIIIYILFIMMDSLYITYEKYMMDKLYYSPFMVLFFIGILFSSVAIISIIYVIINETVKPDSKRLLENFSDYFIKHDYKIILIYLFYNSIFRFVINILKILTVSYFSPNHTYTAYIIIKLVDLLIKNDYKYKYFSIICFIPQFLGLLIFLEIIELNFCKLNKNTKRNIRKRESEEIIINDEDDEDEKDGRYSERSIAEVSPGYYIENELLNFKDDRDSRTSRNTTDVDK